MPIAKFPDSQLASPDGILAVGGDLHPQSLLLAYRQGIFPWPIEGLGLAWFHPDPRAILEFADLKISRSLSKARKKTRFQMTLDQDFSQVISACAQMPRKGQQGTWITPQLKKAYEKFHDLGYAHSVEVWEGSNLVGGLYGVAVEGVFSAESMFHLKPNASKLALLHLIDYLSAKRLTWLDIQVITPHMKVLGAKEISRSRYLKKLAEVQAKKLKLF